MSIRHLTCEAITAEHPPYVKGLLESRYRSYGTSESHNVTGAGIEIVNTDQQISKPQSTYHLSIKLNKFDDISR